MESKRPRNIESEQNLFTRKEIEAGPLFYRFYLFIKIYKKHPPAEVLESSYYWIVISVG